MRTARFHIHKVSLFDTLRERNCKCLASVAALRPASALRHDTNSPTHAPATNRDTYFRYAAPRGNLDSAKVHQIRTGRLTDSHHSRLFGVSVATVRDAAIGRRFVPTFGDRSAGARDSARRRRRRCGSGPACSPALRSWLPRLCAPASSQGQSGGCGTRSAIAKGSRGSSGRSAAVGAIDVSGPGLVLAGPPYKTAGCTESPGIPGCSSEESGCHSGGVPACTQTVDRGRTAVCVRSLSLRSPRRLRFLPSMCTLMPAQFTANLTRSQGSLSVVYATQHPSTLSGVWMRAGAPITCPEMPSTLRSQTSSLQRRDS
jgi:DNA-binding transcriptional regulator YiaG